MLSFNFHFISFIVILPRVMNKDVIYYGRK